MAKEYEKKGKENLPVLAICYDFDKTLSPDNMQAQGYIQSVGYENADVFWTESNALAADNDMDQNLAYMRKMIDDARGILIPTKDKLKEYGERVSLYPGVEEWFERINEYGKSKGIIVEHYIISSGLKEMIEGTSIAQKGVFEKIYANSYFYDEKGVPVWPAQIINYTNKTQFLFRIEKGRLDINDEKVNEQVQSEEVRIPFRNIVYIGDSDTDVPCMKLVNSYGGHSIGVYNGDKAKVYKMMRENRIKYFAPADYSEGSPLDSLLKSIIDKTQVSEVLESFSDECKMETKNADDKIDAEELKKIDALIELECSCSFAQTHEIIGTLSKFSNWTDEQKEKLCEIAIDNSQVNAVLQDNDVKRFYKKALVGYSSDSDYYKKVKEKLKIK